MFNSIINNFYPQVCTTGCLLVMSVIWLCLLEIFSVEVAYYMYIHATLGN